MRGAPLILLALLVLDNPIQPLSAQPRRTVPPASLIGISSAEIKEDGGVQIALKNGRSIRVPPQKGQAGREKLQVAFNGAAVGWLDVDAPVGSYSVPTTLTVYTVGRPLRHFGDGLMLLDWDFIDDDKHIQFSSSQVHGPGTDWHIIEVHDLETGRLLERWSERADTADPDVLPVDVRGSVTDSGGVALPNTVVSIGAAAEPLALTTSNRGGRFTLKGISPGQYEVRFEHPRFKKRTVQITVGTSGEAVDTGTVALEREPVRKQ